MTDAELSGFLRTNSGANVAFREAGPRSGTPIVLIAGWPQSLHAWRHVQQRFAEQNVRTIALDPPGLGASDVLASRDAYTTTRVAHHLAEAIGELGLSAFTLVGHDIGAWIAYAWAATRPAGISRLVLLDAAIPGAMAQAAFPLDKAPGIFQFYFNAVPDLPEKLTQGRERIYLEWLFSSKTRVAGAITQSDIDAYLEWYAQPERMSAGFDYYRCVPASIEELANVQGPEMPVLALGGEFALGAAMLGALEPYCPVIAGGVVPESGHYLAEEAPGALVARIGRFLVERVTA